MRTFAIFAAFVLLTAAASAGTRPGFDPKPGTQLTVSGIFRDSGGRAGPLSGWIGGRPALVILGYDTCPNLCGTVQDVVAGRMQETALPPADYRALFVSVNPAEGPGDAATAKARLARAFPGGIAAWRFLTGPGEALAREAGMDLTYRERAGDIVHPAAILVVTPDGRLSRVLPALTVEPRDLELALVEASAGRIGGLADRIYLLCAGYDATQGRYTPRIMALLQAGGVLTVALMAAAIFGMRRR